MRTTWIATATCALALAAALPATAQSRAYGSNSLRFYLGAFEPDGESEYFDDKQLDFTGKVGDFEDLTFGFDYVHNLRGNLRLVAGGTAFSGDSTQAYIDFTDGFGNDLVHDTELSIATATVGLAVALAPSRAPVIPYVGAGGGLYAWSLREEGEFIDFGVDPIEIFDAEFEDDGVAFGWYWMAGLEIPVTPNLAVFGQGRWHHADDELEGDFEGLGELDLSGREISGGISWSF